jgi:hypothetical protein
LGIEEPMAILKVGDYVFVGSEWGGWVGVIQQLDFHPQYHLVWKLDNSSPMALLRNEKSMTLIDPAFHKLLTDVYKESDDEKISNKPT